MCMLWSFANQDSKVTRLIRLSSSSSYSDAEGLEREKSSSQDQSSLPGHRNKPRVSSTLTLLHLMSIHNSKRHADPIQTPKDENHTEILWRQLVLVLPFITFTGGVEVFFILRYIFWRGRVWLFIDAVTEHIWEFEADTKLYHMIENGFSCCYTLNKKQSQEKKKKHVAPLLC